MCLVTNTWQYWRVFCPCCTPEKQEVCAICKGTQMQWICLYGRSCQYSTRRNNKKSKKNCMTLSTTDWCLSQHCMENLLSWLDSIQNAAELANIRQWNSEMIHFCKGVWRATGGHFRYLECHTVLQWSTFWLDSLQSTQIYKNCHTSKRFW